MLHRFRVRRARRTFVSLAMLVAVSGLALLSAGGGTAAEGTSTYIVQMLQQPAVAYTGGIAGFPATKPAKGKKIDPDAADVTKYVGYLKTQHDSSLAKVGSGQKVYDYGISYNGYAAKLTDAQAAALKNQKDVLAVTPNELVTVDTTSTPHFLGLDAPGGLWDQLGGPDGTRSGVGAGENIIIGDVDSGIWPESKSFSDRDASGKLIYQPINTANWHGKKCVDVAENWSSDRCNKKLLGAQYFNAAWGGNEALEAERPWEFMSPRDYNGHGTHTASTAGGNHGTPTTGPAAGFGSVSGMAPRARIAVYKALWSTQDASTASGFTADLVAAIDQAVADGVDAINYSISGTSTNFLDPVEVSFLFATDAGVFVSESAGNSGPTDGTVAHPAPWTTTVAAGTHNRNGIGSVTLGNGVTYSGASVAAPVGPAPFIDSTAAGLPGANATALALCFTAGDNGGTAVLDPAKVAGKIVLCDRGTNARVNKSLAVKQAGGVGMVLANTSPNSLNADFHFVPTVHVANTDRAALKAYAATAGATAKINQATITFTDPAPFTAAFSSRGPLVGAGGDLLKPDVIAPGQDILAAVAPPGQAGLDFNLLSGTSMSAPHVTGVAALLMQRHPDWSPMAIKSALMTSGTDVLDFANSSDPREIFRQGAGHIRPNGAADPGLVYDNGFNDWLAFLCGAQPTGVNPASCTALKNAGYSTDPSDMNTASIAIGDLGGIQTVRRRVTNVGSSTATYNASIVGMSGITTAVTPSSLTLNPGQTGSFTVTFTRVSAPLNAYTGGYLKWSDGTHNVRIPLVIRPVALGAPIDVAASPGGTSYSVVFGYDGPFTATARGLVPAAVTADTIADDPDDAFVPTANADTKAYTVTVPAGTTVARFQLFNDDVTAGTDMDLYVFRGGTQVGSSAGGTSDERVTLVDPAAATYTVWVHGFAVAGGSSPFKLYSWVLGSADAGNMTVTAPTTAVTGQTGTIALSFSGLAAGVKYLGSVAYGGIAGLPNPTIVRVDG
jgi:subtilisin family serine protease